MQKTRTIADAEMLAEAKRLHENLRHLGYSINDCLPFAPYTLRINELKKRKNAVILAHNYQRPEILFGIADFKGDSLALSKNALSTEAELIVFCGVHFMAETAKILNPEKKVLLPDLRAGCSLDESITAADVRSLKAKHPGIPVVTYVNTSAAVKAESDVICTSANALKVIEALPDKKVIFIPDEFMAKNLAKVSTKEIISWNGKCIVHESFTGKQVDEYRSAYPGLKVLSHLECPPEVIERSDLVGGTSDMSKYIEKSNEKQFMLVTECGMSDMLKVQHPEKDFIVPCSICPHMKRINLENVLEVLEKETNEITVPKETAIKARKALDRMLKLTN